MSTEFEFDVFLSHNSEDKEPFVEPIAQRLKSEFGLNPFLDKWNLIPGTTWPKELERALDQSATTAVFLGTGGKGPWHDQEMQRALVKAVKTHEEYRIIPVLLPGADDSQVSGFLGLRTWVDFRSGVEDEQAFNRLVGGIKGEAIDTGDFKLPGDPAPYRGLSRFEKEQSGFFFGRTQDIERLIAKLGNERFVAVLGASGSGKSSLVRAGLLPRLDEDALPGSQAWRVILFMPGSEPLRALANQLALKLPEIDRPEAADRLVPQLGKGEHGLRNTLTSWYADSPAPLLLVIDQFEELFTQCSSETRSSTYCKEAARTLIAGVADLVQSGGGEIRVLITLRADFLDRCLEFPVLRELLQDRQLLLGEMGDEALREAIVLPAQNVGAFFEKGLVNLILRDVTGEHGSLPLLQHALFELWKARRGPWLMQDAYEQSGGVTGALKRFAQRIYDGLNPEEQTIARNIFGRITSLGEGVSDTRRRVPRKDLYPAGVKPAAVDRVIERLSGKDARLIVSGEEGVEITHESLLREWDTLRGWLESNRDAQRLRQQITEAAQLWEKDGRSDDDLYKGARLELAEQWEQDHPKTLTDLERAFLDAGKARRSREQDQLERERQEKEVQRQKELDMARELAEKERLRAEEADARRLEQEASEQRLRKRAWGLGILTLTAVVFMAGAIWYWNAAVDNAERARAAEVSATTAEAIAIEEAGNAQEQLLNANFNLARAFEEKAVNALEKAAALTGGGNTLDHTRNAWLFATAALSQKLAPKKRSLSLRSAGRLLSLHAPIRQRWRSKVRIVAHPGGARSVAFSPDGKLLVSAGEDGSLRLWVAESGKAIGEPLSSDRGPVGSVAFSADGERLVSLEADNSLRFWDVASGDPIGKPITVDQLWLNDIAFSPDGKWLATAGQDGTIQLRDPITGRALGEPLSGQVHGPVNSIAFGPKSRRLASAGHDGKVQLWDPAAGKRLGEPLSGHDYGSLTSVAFSPNGTHLAASGWSGTVLWDLAGGDGNPLWFRKDREQDIAFSPSGHQLATAGTDGVVHIRDVADGNDVHEPMSGHEGEVWSIAFSADGKRLVSAGKDGTVRIWDVVRSSAFGESLPGHSGEVLSVAFSPDGKRLASGGTRGTVRFWDAISGRPSGKPLSADQGWVEGIAFSPDGERLATAGSDGTVRLWDVSGGHPQPQGERLSGHNGQVRRVAFSPDGKWLISAGDDDTRLWDPISGSQIDAPLTGDVGWLRPDAKWLLASLDANGIMGLWDPESRRMVGEPISVHGGPVDEVSFGADGKRLAFVDGEGTVRQWDAISGGYLGEPLTTHQGYLLSIAFSLDGARLATVGANRTVRLWDAATGKAMGEPLSGHRGRVHSVAFSPDARLLASADGGGTVAVWDVADGSASVETLVQRRSASSRVAFSPDGKRMASVGIGGGTAWFWDSTTESTSGEPLDLSGHLGGQLHDLAFSPDGRWLAYAGYMGSLRLLDLASGTASGKPIDLRGHKRKAVTSIAFSPDSKRLASADYLGTVRLWDPVQGKNLGEPIWDEHTGLLPTVAFSPDGRWLAFGGRGGILQLRDPSNGKPSGDPFWIGAGVTDIAFSPSGTRLATTAEDGSVRLWDPISGSAVGNQFSGHKGEVWGIAFSQDGTWLATAGEDGTVRLWDPASGTALGNPLSDHKGRVVSVAFSPDSTRLLSGGEDGTIRLWSLPDPRIRRLFSSSGEYRGLAISLAEALSLLWELEIDGITLRSRPHPLSLLPSEEGYFFSYDDKFADLLKPPKADESRLDQVLRWAEQQSGIRLEP